MCLKVEEKRSGRKHRGMNSGLPQEAAMAPEGMLGEEFDRLRYVKVRTQPARHSPPSKQPVKKAFWRLRKCAGFVRNAILLGL